MSVQGRSVFFIALLIVFSNVLPAESKQGNTWCYAGKTFRAEWRHKENALVLEETNAGSFRKAYLSFCILNGQDRHPVSLAWKTSITREGMPGAVFENADCGLAVSVVLQTVEYGVLWNVEFRNSGRTQLWLEPGVHSRLALDKSWNLWNGSGFYPGVSKEVFRSYLDDHAPGTGYLYNPTTWTFPLTVFYGPKTGLALGLHPDDLTSYVGNQFSPISDSEALLSCASRLVLDPGQAETRRFVFLHFPSQYGYEAAIERYYKTFPSCFRTFAGVDSRIRRGSGYVHWKQFDQPRRTWSGWGWCYAPFKRNGDPYGHQEYWDYVPGKEPAKYFPPTLTVEQYRRERKAWFSQGKEFDVMMMFYLNPTWAEEQLAKKEYPQTLIEDPRVDCRIAGWTTGHDIEVLVYPWGNKLGELYQRDMKKLLEDVDLDGFGFDVACPGWGRYRNSANTNTPGRAWDNQGVFVDAGIAQALLMDYTHSLVKNGRPLGVVMNGGGYLGFHADSGLAEYGVFSGQTLEGALHVRYFFGQKGYDLWDSYDKTARLINYDSLDAMEIREVARNFGRYAIILALRLGATIGHNLVVGNEELFRALPVVTEVAEAGWWPVCPVSCDKAIWTGRTGQGISSYLTFGNQTLNDITSSVTIDQAEIGPADYLFGRFAGAPIELKFEKGKTTAELQIPSYQWEVLKCRGSIEPAGYIEKATVRTNGDIHRGSLVVECESGRKFTGRVELRLDPEQRAIRVSVNGREIRYTQNDRTVAARAVLSEGRNLIEIRWRSTVFENSFEELTSFRFVEEEATGEFKPLVTIVVPERPGPATQVAAQRLQNYFYFWTQYRKLSVMKPDYRPEGARIPIVPGDRTESKIKQAVVIGPAEHNPSSGVSLDKQSNTLCVNGRTEEQLRDNLNSLLRVLDRKYPYYYKLQAGLPAFERAGLTIKNVNQWPYLPARETP